MRFAERQLRLALVVLLAAAAVLLAVGAALEGHQNADQSQAVTVTRASGAAAAGETGESGAEAGSAPAATGDQHGSGEWFFGVAESLPLTIVAVVVSVALALAVWARPGRLVVWLVLVAVVVLASADARELIHHLREARPAVATIAGVLLAVHVVAAGVATLLVARERSAPSRVLAS